MSNLCLLRHFQRIVDFDAEITNGALQLAVPEKQLHSAQVLGSAVD